jgi:WD40 repeat protein
LTTTSPSVRPKGRFIFISYARNDGSAAAHQLCQALKAAGCDVWLDTEQIHGGSSWGKDIEGALASCDVLVAVLTPESYDSEICRSEQIWALDEGKVVIPVLAVPGAPVPIHLKSRNYRKYPEQEAELLLDIASDPAPLVPAQRALHYDTVPSLPSGYIARDKAVADLRDAVFMGGEDTSIAVTALAGMGGIGKTVLAIALCRELAVQRAFPDGIAWITFGRDWNGDLLTRMREIGRALGENVDKGWDSQQACANRYRTILLKKAALVVIDDVWSLEQLKPMLVNSPRSRLVFTTRDTTIGSAITNRHFSADLLSESEARELLARAAGIKTRALPPDAAGIIRKCNGLALAIAQIGGSLKGKPTEEWSDTLEALRRADISDIEERLPSGQQSFFKSLAVSVQALPPVMQDRLLKLAVLLEDVPAPIAILQALWKLDERKARHSARYLVDRSLASWAFAGDAARGIKLHDLQLDYVRAIYTDQAALDLILSAARLSSPIIDQDPGQFSSQLVGRLLEYDQMPSINRFTATISDGAPRPWLRPLRASLVSPSGKLIPESKGHLASVIGVALTNDGRRVISASLDDTVKVWDRKTGTELLTLRGHRLGVYSVSVSANGKRALSASLDKTLKVWDLRTGREVRTIKDAHSRAVACAVLSPDGRKAISASWDKTMKLWDLDNGVSLRTFKGHSKCLNSVAVSSDWKIAVSASEDKTLKIWNVETGSIVRTLKGHTADVWAVAITPDAGLAVSASEDKTLKVWNLKTGRKPRTLKGHTSAVYGVAISSDRRFAVSCSDDMTLKVWDLRNGRVLHTLEGHSLTVMSVALSADGKSAVSCSYDASLKIWDLTTGSEIRTLKGRSDALNAVAISSDGRFALFASDDKTIKIWDFEAGACIRTLSIHSRDVCDVAIRGDGRLAASVSGDETLKVWDVGTGEEIRKMSHGSWVNGIAVSADFKLAVSACDDNVLKVWNLDTGEELRTLRGHRSSAYAVALSADGRLAVSASYDATLRVWNVEKGRSIHKLKGHREPVTCVVLTLDGRLALSGSDDGSIRTWDLNNGQNIRTVEAHSDSVSYLAISNDQKCIASASWDKTVKVWDRSTGSLTATFTCDAPALCCGFLSNRELIVGDHLGRIHVLSIEGK